MMTRVVGWLMAGAIMLLAACGDTKADAEEPAGESAGHGALPEKTAAVPASPCDWIPAGDVEAVVGKLNGAPREERGGCFYPLTVDSVTIARRAREDSMRAAVERMGLGTDLPAQAEDTAGVLIQVAVGGGPGERAVELGFGTVGTTIDKDSLFAAQRAGDGWDYRRALPGKPNFMGRAGTVMVVVESGTNGMDGAVLATLAARVRDRIPDLPFVDPNAASGVPSGPDPCVLSRAEAEAVLGKLVVAPYRVWKGGALAHPGGQACAYSTAGHRALVVAPHFTGGAEQMRIVRAGSGIGAVGIGDREAEGADTLEGPWDEAAIGIEGQLAMRKGQQMLEIVYLTSSTDITGAIRLAGPALERLAKTTGVED